MGTEISHPASGALAAAIDTLHMVDPDVLCDTELHEMVVDVSRQMSRLEAAQCRPIRRWDTRRVWADTGSKAAGARLARETGMRPSCANRLVARARHLATMPATTEAYNNGDVNGDHVDLIGTCDQTWRNDDFRDAEQLLVNTCRTAWFHNAVRAVEYWKHHADRDAADQGADIDRQGRHASISTGWRGEVVLTAIFDPLGGETFQPSWTGSVTNSGYRISVMVSLAP